MSEKTVEEMAQTVEDVVEAYRNQSAELARLRSMNASLLDLMRVIKRLVGFVTYINGGSTATSGALQVIQRFVDASMTDNDPNEIPF